MRDVVSATERGYELATEDPAGALDDLVAGVPGLDRGDQNAQLRALLHANALKPEGGFRSLGAWARWDVQHGILQATPDLQDAFDSRFLRSGPP